MKIEVPDSPDEDNHHEHWLRQEHTQKLRRGLRKEAYNAHVTLMSRCQSSSDPEVRAAYERYTGIKTTQLLFESESSKKDPDASQGG